MENITRTQGVIITHTKQYDSIKSMEREMTSYRYRKQKEWCDNMIKYTKKWKATTVGCPIGN